MRGRKIKFLALPVVCLLAALLSAAAWSGRASGGDTPVKAAVAIDAERVANLLSFMERANLEALPSIDIKPFEIPDASVDVMRVRLEETYDIQGVGKDTVVLKGWIAVKHDNPRAAVGETEVKWGTAVSDTEFVGMDLRGESKIFGPVRVTLNPDMQSRGQVGKLDLPPHELEALHAAYVAAIAQTEAGSIPTTKAPVMRERGYAGIPESLAGIANAIQKGDKAAWLRYYDTSPRNVYFGNNPAGLKTVGAQRYGDAMFEQRQNLRSIRINYNDDLMVLDGAPNKHATISVTGTNEVVDLEGRRASSAWRLTQTFKRVGNSWKSVHDHLSFFTDPNKMEVQGLRNAAAKCAAQASVKVNMPRLDLELKTKFPVLWYSEVETIPPVGYTASISATPTPLLSSGREVGTLTSGAVKFREVVQRVPLLGTKWGAGDTGR